MYRLVPESRLDKYSSNVDFWDYLVTVSHYPLSDDTVKFDPEEVLGRSYDPKIGTRLLATSKIPESRPNKFIWHNVFTN